MNNVIHTSEANSGTDPSISKGYFVAEIQSMMHGFGDAKAPLLESACLIETVVQQQQRTLINQAADVAAMRGVKCVGPEDILFLLRKDRVKIQRLLKYLAVRDLKSNINNVLGESSVEGDLQLDTSLGTGKKRSRLCLDFLQSIDQTGELTDTSSFPIDIVKYERNVRAERASRELNQSSYLEFVNARRASFASRKSGPKFREWLRSKSDVNSEVPKISDAAYDLLSYMAYETVAQIMDLTLLVRQDNMARPGVAFSRYLPSAGYSTHQTLDSRQIESAPPLTPSEIREALRRYWTSPVGPASHFTRNLTSHVHSRLLSC
ncbi:transcription initiation protein SPT3 homolog [Periplaneta americana]|uniref:transcription initiation protein SPT3 homolog n=1 Tax=Periplaneta americana TaxID=6978 RepID=UPI0037E977C1